MLGDAGRGVRATRGRSETARVLSGTIQNGDRSSSDCSGWKLSGRAKKNEALWLFAVQPRSNGDNLPDSFDAAGQPLHISNSRWSRISKGHGIHDSVYRQQEILGLEAGRDVRRSMAYAAEQS